MLKTLTATSIGLILAGSLSAKEMTIEDLAASAEGHSLPGALERPDPRDATATESPGALGIPAWQEPGFVMDEVIATARPTPIEVSAAPQTSPNLESLLELHRAARSLKF